MDIRIPKRVVTVWDKFCDWANVDVIWRVRRIDIIIAVFFIFCVSWYSWTGGWLGFFTGALAFIFVTMAATWLL